MSDVQPVEPVPPISPPVQLAHGMGFSRKMPSSAKQSLINLSLGMGIMLAALSGGAYLMITNKEALLGGKASVDKQSSFSFTAPTQVKPGEEFTVDVILDASADPEHTISGADAVIQYSFTPDQQPLIGSVTGDSSVSGISWEEQSRIRPTAYPMFTLVRTEPGTIFDSYPQPSLPVTPVPSTSPVSKMPCGGIAGVLCPSDMLCQIDMKNVPDASGYCVPNPNTVPEVLGETTNESKKLALSPPAPQPTFTPPQYGGGSGGPSQTTTPFVPPPRRPPNTPPPNTPPPNTPVPTSTSVPLVIQGTTTISGIKKNISKV